MTTMPPYVLLCRFAAVLFAVTLTGCLPKMTIEDIKAMQPQRPAELDHLEMLLGEWETTGEAEMAVLDHVLRTTGSNKAEWALDRWMVIDHADLNMGELGRMTGLSIWTWDPRIKKHRMQWFDSFGETSNAIAAFNEKTRTWHISAKGQKYGFATSGKGTLRQIDADTLEWTWKEYDRFGLILLADMKGISRRK